MMGNRLLVVMDEGGKPFPAQDILDCYTGGRWVRKQGWW